MSVFELYQLVTDESEYGIMRLEAGDWILLPRRLNKRLVRYSRGGNKVRNKRDYAG